MICLMWSKIAAHPFSGALSIQSGPFHPQNIPSPSLGPHGLLFTHLTMFTGGPSQSVLRGQGRRRMCPALVKATTLWKREDSLPSSA